MENLIHLIGEKVNSEVLQTTSGLIGESEEKTRLAIDTVVPALVAAMALRSSTISGAEQLLNVVVAHRNRSVLRQKLRRVFESKTESESALDTGYAILSVILGYRMSGVVSLVTSVAGIRRESSSFLLGLLAPLIVTVVGDQIDADRVSSLKNLFEGQNEYLKDSAPGGLPGVLGVSDLDALTAHASVAEYEPTTVHALSVRVPEMRMVGGLGWLLPAIGLLAVVSLLWWLFVLGADASAHNLAVI